MVGLVEFGAAISADEMIASFARGEIDSPRYGRYWKEMLVQLGQPRPVVDSPNLSSPEENWVRRWMLTKRRGYPDQQLFQGLPSDVVWHQGSVPRESVGDLLYGNFGAWLTFSGGTRLVRHGAANIDTVYIGDDGTNDFIREAECLIAAGMDVGKLLLVSTDRAGPFVLIEGHARATGHALNIGRVPAPVSVLVGLSPSMAGWCLW